MSNVGLGLSFLAVVIALVSINSSIMSLNYRIKELIEVLKENKND